VFCARHRPLRPMLLLVASFYKGYHARLVNAIQFYDAVARLRLIAENAADDDLRFFASRLKEELNVTLQFKSGGMYTEAKHIVGFVRRHTQEFASDTRADGEIQVALDAIGKFADEVLKLPDTVRVIDRSAAIVRSTELPRKPPGPYWERYPVGSPVKIAPLEELEEFMKTYKYHHALVPEQLEYAGMLTIVRTVGYYHGGDVVYTLEATEKFAWLEPSLRDGRATSGQR
jgi:hypothetical protein